MTNRRTASWRDVASVIAVVLTFAGVFAYALTDLFGDIHARDPFAPVAALGAVILAAVVALTAGFGVMMLLGNRQ
jgi:hypothetical protein